MKQRWNAGCAGGWNWLGDDGTRTSGGLSAALERRRCHLLSERQLSDAAGVAAVQRETLDIPYLKQWAEHNGVSIELSKLLRGEVKLKQT